MSGGKGSDARGEGAVRTHAIKLKGPWTVRLVTQSTDSGPADPQVVHLPADWRTLFGDDAAAVEFQRRFNRPTGLTSEHRVRIEFHDVPGLAGVQLNGRPLPIATDRAGVQTVDVTSSLEPHNELKLDIRFDPRERPGLPGGLWRPVVIRIEEP